MVKTYVSIVQYFVSTWFALMASNEEAQFILLEEIRSHVWTEVCPSTAKCVRHTAARALGVRPQDIKYL